MFSSDDYCEGLSTKVRAEIPQKCEKIEIKVIVFVFLVMITVRAYVPKFGIKSPKSVISVIIKVSVF